VLFGLEIHPSVVHFPIALTIVGALFSVLYVFTKKDWMRWFAPLLLSLALAGAVTAYFTGQAASDRAEKIGVPDKAIEEHEESGLWALGMIAVACLLGWATHARRKGTWVAMILTLLAASVVARTAHLGGQLVYVHGAGRVQGAPGVAGQTPEGGEGKE